MERRAAPADERTLDEADLAAERAVERERAVAGFPSLRDRVRWGPIVAGFLTTIVALVTLTILGVAIGLSAFDPGDEGIGTAAAVWGIVSVLLAFFAGGLMAARTAADPTGTGGAVNGFMVGVTAIVALLWLIGSGLGNVLGAAATNIGELAAIGAQVDVPAEQATAAHEEARNSAWGTFIGLVLALGAATLGGFLGHRWIGSGPDEPVRARR